MNSFNFVARGITREVERQIEVRESGAEVVQQTYDYDAAHDRPTPRRAKEEADDYRYFPEPDMVPLEPEDDLVERVRAELPELPAARIRRIEQELDLDRAVVLVMGGLDRLWEGHRGRRRDRGAAAAANVIANTFVGAGVDPAVVQGGGTFALFVDARERIPRAAFDEAISSAGRARFFRGAVPRA